MTSIKNAINAMRIGYRVRHENFAAGTWCSMDVCTGLIDDPELGYVSETEFLESYENLEDNWIVDC